MAVNRARLKRDRLRSLANYCEREKYMGALANYYERERYDKWRFSLNDEDKRAIEHAIRHGYVDELIELLPALGCKPQWMYVWLRQAEYHARRIRREHARKRITGNGRIP